MDEMKNQLTNLKMNEAGKTMAIHKDESYSQNSKDGKKVKHERIPITNKPKLKPMLCM